MKTIVTISLAAVLAASAAHAGVIVDKAMPTAEIAKLPRDKVDAIKRACARLYEYDPNYESRIAARWAVREMLEVYPSSVRVLPPRAK